MKNLSEKKVANELEAKDPNLFYSMTLEKIFNLNLKSYRLKDNHF